MATSKPRKPAPKAAPKQSARSSRGSTLPAFVFGMVFGLLIALGVALFVTKTELPFSGAKTQADEAKVSPGPGKGVPDPNSPIYNKAGANSDSVVTTDPDKAAVAGRPGAAEPNTQPIPQTQYFLQMGSFRNREDAEQLRAKLAFVGTESEIFVGEVNGNVVNRVRVGPFTSANQAYQARVPLTKGGFDATVVKE